MTGLLFVLGTCVIATVIGLFQPLVALLAYVCFAVLRPPSLWFFSLPDLNYSRIIGMSMLLGWSFRRFGRWHFGQATPVVYSLIVFWLWSIVRSIGVPDPERASVYVSDITKIVLPFLVGITIVNSYRQVRWLIWTILLSQGYLALEFNRWYFAGLNRLALDGFGGMDNNSNGIALVTCVGLSVFAGLFERRILLRLLAFSIGALLIHSILLSLSRGAMLALVLSAIIIFRFLPKTPTSLACCLIAIIAVFTVTGPAVMARFNSSFAPESELDDSAKSRLELWSACIDLMLHNPFGIGAAQFADVAPRYGFPRGKLAHSFWLQLGAELGFPGLLSIVSFYGFCILRLWRYASRRHTEDDPLAPFAARMVISSLIAFACAAQFVSLYAVEQPYYVALIGAIVLKLLGPTSDTRITHLALQPRRRRTFQCSPSRIADGPSQRGSGEALA